MSVYEHKVVLIDYSEELYSPVGFEAEMLARANASWVTHHCQNGDEVLEVARDADVIAIQSVKPLLTREVLAKTTRCRCTIRAGAGYDSIDYKAATEMGIMVCNAPTYCTDDVADHAMGLMLAGVRNIVRLDKAMHEKRYIRALARPSRRLAGATMGIIGLGRIGSTTARRAHGWDMTILAYDPYVPQEQADVLGVKMVSLEELLERVDFLSIHCLLTDETHHLLSWDEFKRIKPGVVLANTARGAIIDEPALIAALQEGRVWAAGLDVTEQEPPADDSPLWTMDNVILTPHVSANTPESQRDLYRIVCEISTDVVQGRIPEWVVNPDVLDHLRAVK